MDDIERDRKRPIELRVRVQDGTPGFDGISEREATRFGRFSADALVVVRALFQEDAGIVLGVMALNGHDPSLPMSPSALFHVWLGLTGELARRAAEDGDTQGAQQISFARKVLTLLQLDERMRALSDPEVSTPAAPSSPPDGVASSTG